jgi:hypothetical protein
MNVDKRFLPSVSRLALALLILCVAVLWSEPISDNTPDTTALTFEVPGRPVRLDVSAAEQISFWTVTLEDGRLFTFRLEGRNLIEISLPAPRVFPDASALTTPVILPMSGRTAYVADDGDLVVIDGSRSMRLGVKALPDAIILADEFDRVLVLTDPTNRYGHGILGDRIEAAGITLIETWPIPQVVRKIDIPAPDVIEGLSPLWVDLDGNKSREIIVTISDSRQGARLVVFDEFGSRVATGPAIGQGNRWRHQLAVAPFGPRGELEIADVLTPHIGGVVEFFQLNGDRLLRTASLRGYSTHVIGSRNLEMAFAGDFDGDGRFELLVPTQDFRSLAAIRRTADGAVAVWELFVGDRITTNVAAVNLSGGNIVIGLGTADGTVWIWPIEPM